MVSKKAFDDALAAKEVGAAQVKAAQAALAEAKLNLAYTRVESPISGVASRALVSEGSLVEAQRTLLTDVSQIDPIRVIFSMAEAERLNFATRGVGRACAHAQGEPLRRDPAPARRHHFRAARRGRLQRPARQSADRHDRVSRDAAQPGSAAASWAVRARAAAGRTVHQALAVPQRAVLEGPQGKMLFVVDEKGLAQPRPVQVGNWAGEQWVITSGLKPGDRVIVDGVMKIRPGAPVTIAQAPPAAPTGAAAPPPAAAKQ